jgi:hypothetical protein
MRQPKTPLSDIPDDRKTNRKGLKQLQFYDGLGNLIRFEGLAVSIIGVYLKSRIIVQDRGVK